MADISPQPILQFFDDNGDPLVGGKLYTYAAGTTTPLQTYTSASGSSLNTNPVILNSRGEAQVWLGASQYKFVLKTSTDVEIWTVDNLSSFNYLASLLAASNGASMIGYSEGGSGAVTRTVQAKLREFISVKDFGASSTASATDNRAAFQAAIDAVQEGATIWVPTEPSYYSIDIVDFNSALVINKALTFQIDGEIRSNSGASTGSLPAFLFNITANNVAFIGSGTISGSGSVNDTSSSVILSPGLVFVSGNNFTMTGLTIDTPPQIGVYLNNCTGARIINNTFTGGITTNGSGTVYFGVCANQGYGHNISFNSFVPSASGGMMIDGIFFAQTSHSLIEGNYIKNPYEKLCYLYGDYNIITGNSVYGNTDLIPGTSQKGTLTSVYRVNGNYNKISNNYSDYCLAGATALNGIYNEITENTFHRCGQWGVTVYDEAASGAVAVNHTIIRGNTITPASDMTNVILAGGILVQGKTVSVYSLNISDNKISDFSSTSWAGIVVNATSPYNIYNSTIKNNHITGCGNGISTGRVLYSEIDGNFFYGISGYMLIEGTGNTGNVWSNNHGNSITNYGINGYVISPARVSTAYGNQYNAVPLQGRTYGSTGNPVTISTGNVAPNAIIVVQPSDSNAATFVKTNGMPYTAVSGVNFTMTFASGTLAGSEYFTYQIIQ